MGAVQPPEAPPRAGRASREEREAHGGGGGDGARSERGRARRLLCSSLCIFCGERSEAFTDEGLDLHYWRHCLMLTRCDHCRQVGAGRARGAAPGRGRLVLAGSHA